VIYVKRIICVLLVLSSLAVPLSSAQAEAPNWEIGWETEESPVIMQLDEDYDFELTIIFWVSNSHPTPIDLDFEVSGVDGFEVDDPGKITVEANSNETMDLIITGRGVDSNGDLYSADSIYATLSLKAIQLIAEQNVGDDEIDRDLQFSTVHNLVVTLMPVEGSSSVTVKAGTSESLLVKVKNTGNSADAIADASASFRGCPQMGSEFTSEMSNVSIGLTASVEAGLKIMASSSHHEKTCTLVVSVVSEGSGKVSTSELEFQVESPEADSPVDNNGDSNSNGSISDFDVESSSLPAPSLIAGLLCVIFAAIFRRDF
jgi:hypothetical protein